MRPNLSPRPLRTGCARSSITSPRRAGTSSRTCGCRARDTLTGGTRTMMRPSSRAAPNHRRRPITGARRCGTSGCHRQTIAGRAWGVGSIRASSASATNWRLCMWPTSGGELSRAQHEHVEPTRVGGGLYGEMADHQLLPMLVLPGCSSPTPRGKPRIGSISPANTVDKTRQRRTWRVCTQRSRNKMRVHGRRSSADLKEPEPGHAETAQAGGSKLRTRAAYAGDLRALVSRKDGGSILRKRAAYARVTSGPLFLGRTEHATHVKRDRN